jgi:hypothetical protein
LYECAADIGSSFSFWCFTSIWCMKNRLSFLAPVGDKVCRPTRFVLIQFDDWSIVLTCLTLRTESRKTVTFVQF